MKNYIYWCERGSYTIVSPAVVGADEVFLRPGALGDAHRVMRAYVIETSNVSIFILNIRKKKGDRFVSYPMSLIILISFKDTILNTGKHTFENIIFKSEICVLEMWGS